MWQASCISAFANELCLDEELTVESSHKSLPKVDRAKWLRLITTAMTILLDRAAMNVECEAWWVELVVSTDTELVGNKLSISDVFVVDEDFVAASTIWAREDRYECLQEQCLVSSSAKLGLGWARPREIVRSMQPEEPTGVPVLQLVDGRIHAYPTERTMTVVHADVVLSRSPDKGCGRLPIVPLSE
jgi:hypothetical protein